MILLFSRLWGCWSWGASPRADVSVRDSWALNPVSVYACFCTWIFSSCIWSIVYSREGEVIVGPENVSPWNLVFHFCLSVWLSGFRVASAPPEFVSKQAGAWRQGHGRPGTTRTDSSRIFSPSVSGAAGHLLAPLLPLSGTHLCIPQGSQSAAWEGPVCFPPSE